MHTAKISTLGYATLNNEKMLPYINYFFEERPD